MIFVEMFVRIREMNVTLSRDLAKNIIKTEKQKGPSGDAREPVANGLVNRYSEPRDEQPKEGGDGDVTGPGESGNGNCPRSIPTLHSRSEHERQPVRRDGCVKECDTESGDCNRRENGLVHLRALFSSANFPADKTVADFLVSGLVE
jgi:hypothetical protein